MQTSIHPIASEEHIAAFQLTTLHFGTPGARPKADGAPAQDAPSSVRPPAPSAAPTQAAPPAEPAPPTTPR